MKRKFNAAQVPQFIALESVSVASPCHAEWDDMTGDDRSRFCPSCAKNVYNLSAMTRGEAESLIEEKGGKMCVRYFLREDGTMLTQDCPVGVAALKERSPSFALWASVASIALLAAALVSPSLMTGAQAQPDFRLQSPVPTSTPEPTANTTSPTAQPKIPALQAMMGDVAIPVRPTTAPTPTATPETKPTPKPEPPHPIMGKIAPPSMRLGQMIAVPEKTKVAPPPEPTAEPKPTSKPEPTSPAILGRIALPVQPKTPQK